VVQHTHIHSDVPTGLRAAMDQILAMPDLAGLHQEFPPEISRNARKRPQAHADLDEVTNVKRLFRQVCSFSILPCMAEANYN